MKFHFPAEKVLKLKKQQLKQAENLCNRLQFQIDACQREIDQYNIELEAASQPVELFALMIQREHIARIFENLKITEDKKLDLQQQLEFARAECVKRHQETESLMKYRADLLRDFRRVHSNRELASQTDSMLHRRRRTAADRTELEP